MFRKHTKLSQKTASEKTTRSLTADRTGKDVVLPIRIGKVFVDSWSITVIEDVHTRCIIGFHVGNEVRHASS